MERQKSPHPLVVVARLERFDLVLDESVEFLEELRCLGCHEERERRSRLCEHSEVVGLLAKESGRAEECGAAGFRAVSVPGSC